MTNQDTTSICVDGIWRFLAKDRSEQFGQFIKDYETIRRIEGRFSDDPSYYRSLPFHDLTGRHSSDWRIRATTYRAFLDRVVKPMEASRQRPLRVLDLGAGNCWLSNRLAQRDHSVVAIDLLTNKSDGLGAHRYYQATFTPIQAEFDHLPLASRQADIAIFNGSIHYSPNVEATLREALRVLLPDGMIVMLDSPIYQDPSSGAAMVAEREARFTAEFGFPSNSVPMESYLTFERLERLASNLGIHWNLQEPFYGIRWTLRPWRARLSGHREPARFLLITGTRRGAALTTHSRLRRVTRLWLRSTLRWKARRQRRVVLEQVCGYPLVILPQVFNPRLLRSGELFAARLDQTTIPAGCRVLDLGTGSGIGAITAARWAREVVAVDINPVAVRCAGANVLLNHVEDQVTVREGDLFEPVNVERFDRILFNPPYFSGTPRNLLDLAWRSEDVAERFARQLSQHLTENGMALVILSSDGDEARFINQFREVDLAVQPIARRDLGNEVFTIYQLTVAARNANDRSL